MHMWKDKSLLILFCETGVSEVGTECNRRARNQVSWPSKLGEKLKKKKKEKNEQIFGQVSCKWNGQWDLWADAEPLLLNLSCAEEKKLWMITVSKEANFKNTSFSEQFLSLTELTYRAMSCDHSRQKIHAFFSSTF